VLCLSLCLFRIRPAAQCHVKLRPIERVVPGVAGRWSENAVSVGICGATRLAKARITCSFLARRDLIAVNRVRAVTHRKLAEGTERSFVTKFDRAAVVGRSRDRIV